MESPLEPSTDSMNWYSEPLYPQFFVVPVINYLSSGLLSIREMLSFFTKSKYFYTLIYPNANNCRAFIANDQLPCRPEKNSQGATAPGLQ